MKMENLLTERQYYKPFRYPWAYDLYKEHENMHWLPAEVELREDINDWKFKLDDAERSLLTQLFRFFTQADCFHPDTELMTDRGWLNVKDIDKNTTVAQLDINRNLSFTKPIVTIKKNFSGNLLGFKDGRRKTDLLVTPSHKLLISYQGEHKSIIASEAIFYQNVKQHTACSSVLYNDKSLSSFLRLAIAFQADGSIASDNTGVKNGYKSLRFSFKKQRKIDRLKKLCEDAGLKIHQVQTSQKNYSAFKIEWPLDLVYLLQKDFSWVNLSEFSQEMAKDFIEEISHWDSNVTPSGLIVYTNTNKKACDIVQAISVLAGYTASFSEVVDGRSDKFNDAYKLGISKEYTPVDGQSIARNKYEVPYSGDVYCVTVPDGFVVSRINNNVAITGNCDVAGGYHKIFGPRLGGHPEVSMMMGSFANREAVHIDAYSLLIETVQMPEDTYKTFTQFKEMKEKHEYANSYNFDSIEGLLKGLAIYSAFTEGMQLFSSFAILLNFERFNKMKGMCNIVRWSQRDESMHVQGMTKVFRQLLTEFSDQIDLQKMSFDIAKIARDMVALEDKFIDLCFEQGGIQGLESDEVKTYIRYIANKRWNQLGYVGAIYPEVTENPLKWLDWVVNGREHTNFFEARPTDYAKASVTEDKNPDANW